MTADLAKLYREAQKAIQKEIESFYGKYARDVGVSLEDARKALNKSELKAYLEQTREYYEAIKATDYAFDPAYRQKLHRQLSLKSAVSRLEALQADVQWQIEKLYAQEQNAFRIGLGAAYEESYLRTMFDFNQAFGMASSFSSLNTKMIESAVATKWLGENYSDRIWTNKDRLTLNLEKIIPQGMSLGQSPRVIAKTLDDAMFGAGENKGTGGAYGNALRLVRTEFNKIANDGRYKGLVQAGIEHYKFSAVLDHRTSEICEDTSQGGENNDGVFKLSDKMVGINWPPLHPNCRSTAYAFFPKDEFDEMYPKAVRLAIDENGKIHEVPEDLNFSKWRAGLKPLDGGKVRHVA